MNAVRNDKVDTVIVVNLSRLSHIMLTVYDLMREMEDHGVRFIAIEDHIDALPKHIHDDENGLDYTLNGDYYFPDLLDGEENERPINKWGRIREAYLREHRPGLYASLLLSGKLPDHLADISDAADQRETNILERHRK